MNNTNTNKDLAPAPAQTAAIRDPECEKILELDRAAKRAALIRPESGNPFSDAIRTANCMKGIRAALTPDVMAPIMELQNTRLGFKTDRKEGYGVGIVKDAAIEAIVNGVPLIGNCFNIIAENFYLTREGVTFKLNHVPGLRYQIVPGIPEMVKEPGFVEDRKYNSGKPRSVPGEARIGVRVEWEVGDEKGAQTLTFSIRVNYGMATDAIVGKAFCRAAKWLHARVTGLDVGVSEGDAVDEPKNVTPPEVKREADKPQTPRRNGLRAALDIPDEEEVAPETPATAPQNAQDAPAAPETGNSAPDGQEAR